MAFTPFHPPAPIDAIALHRIDVTVPRHFSFGTWWNRQHVLIQLTRGRHQGWSELLASTNNPDLDLAEFAKNFAWLRGGSAMGDIRSDCREAMELALLDLNGNATGNSALSQLHLDGHDPIAAMPSVLSDDPTAVAAGARQAVDQNFRTHLKVKLFGKPDVDRAVIEAARSVIAPSAFLTGDANGGYGSPQSPADIHRIADSLRQLQTAGLSAAEDPAKMDFAGWIALQEAVGDLPLIADEPIRPARETIDRLDIRIARIFNLHPACMGSIPHTVTLGKLIRGHGRTLMIGDNSLVGPACTQWQQLAIGLGASWVEAIEKPEESPADRYLIRKPTTRLADGRIAMSDQAPGFGIEIDEDALRSMSASYFRL